jgi:hypothetical protein
MATTTPDSSVTEIIAGIVDDFQTLVRQQVAMLRSEVTSDWQKTKRAMLPLICGAGLAFIGLILVCLMFVHLAFWLGSPPVIDPPRIPLWACYGLVAAVISTGAVVMMIAGVRSFQSFNPLPDETARALEGNLKALRDGH